MNVKAIIFDLDGVITDTSELHFIAWRELAESLGIAIDEKFNECLKGVSRMGSLERILQHGHRENDYTPVEKEALATKKNARYVELLQDITPKNVLPGVLSFLEECHKHGIKTALASASKNAPFILDKLEISNHFDYVADAARVAHSKPAPDIFLAAAAGLDIAPAFCLGVEDAAAGIQAIHAAGMKAVGIGGKETLYEADLLLADTGKLNLLSVLKNFTK